MAKNPNRVKKVKKLKRIRKWKKRSIIILSFFVTLIILFIILIYTSLGIKLTTFALNKFLPELKIAQIDGTLHDLHIKDLSLELPGVNVRVDDASLTLAGSCLLKAKICINHFDAKGVNVDLETAKIITSPDKIEVIKMPLPIELKKTFISDVKVKVNDMQFALSDFTGKAKWVKDKLYIYPVVANDLKAIFADPVQTKPKSESDNTIPLNQKINQLFNKPLINTLPDVHIPLDINVTSLSGDNWLLHIAGQDFKFNHVTIQTDIDNNHIVINKVDTDVKSSYANGHATVSGEITLGDSWPVFALINVKTDKNQIDGQFSGKLLGEVSTYTTLSGLNQAKIEGQINFIEKYLPIMAKINGEHIQWPIEEQAQYQLNQFALTLNGSVNKYQLTTKGTMLGKQLPDIHFDIVGNGTNEDATFDHAFVKLPQGEVNLTGKVSWQKALQWDTQIKLDNVDISKEFPAYPIKLAGNIKTTGMLDDKIWQLDLPELQLKGNIKRADFSANGNVSVNSQNVITANNLTLNWGKNRFDLNGSTQKGNLNAKLNLASLSLFIDDMKGSIVGDVKMSGTLNEPIIDTNLTVNTLALHDIAVAKANLTGKVQYKNQLSGKVNLTGQGIELPNQSVKKANIELSGNESHHTLTVNLDGTPASLTTSLTGQIDKNRTKWTGTIPRALLNLGDKNNWQLAKALTLSYDIDQQAPVINAHCWNNSYSSICLDKAMSFMPNTDTSISLKDIDLAKLPIPNDGETKIAGNINGKVTIKFNDTSKIPLIKANINSKKVYVQQLITSQPLTIPFDLFNINAEFNEQQAKIDWNFSLDKLGKIKGDLTIADPMQQKKLSGQLNIDSLALAIVNPLLDKKDYAKGAINGAVKFSGTLIEPYLTGEIGLKHSEIKSSQLPADIKSARLTINFNGKSSVLKGSLATNAGNINLNGRASWNTIDKWQATLTANGAAMEVTVPPMVVMTVVPDIKIEATQDELTLSGKVNIPKGKITVESLPPSSIDVSKDEVMLDRNNHAIKPQQFGMKINSHLEINIEDKVTVDAFGLKASLKGNLIAQQSNKGLDVHGEILIPKGQFKAYGQDLIIRKGILTFSGPTDQVMLDIEAIRNPESMENSNITAGIRVSGLSDDPKVEIFSDPAMSQQEALSYLIRGQGLDSTDQSDNDMMTALLVGLGTAKTGKFIGDFGNVFGIKNLSLDTQGAGDNSKVVVSGYILPNLQLKYGVGIFDSLATFTLSYRLMPNLYLEAASGLAQTLDLIYQFEF
ncbi:autotransporter assembly complex protein TamB [Gilliamella sp. wkB108]|uniref:autotransporter assembly complex protein TamB n=1 Tax=Gilliamella sp. wkB108 TaxID=3120256 RepID=UPI000A91189F|nr:translocation/assembly module TamB domain-containing protein [Gilliamella apicola]